MTDTDYPSISLINLGSHHALQQKIGRTISPLRWRGNFLLDGLTEWEEFELIGKRLKLGGTEIEVRERIKRCMASTANPETGKEDADTLGALMTGFGHTDFGVYAVVVKAGNVAIGDRIEIL
jgi:hypothetical protein